MTFSTPVRSSNRSLLVILGLSILFFLIFVLCSFSFFMGRNLQSSWQVRAKSVLFQSASGVGVLEVNGVILDSKDFLKNFEDFQDSSEVKSIVVRLNSPGGSVAPSQEIYQAVKNSKKPVVASMGSVAASGAYYIAAGAKKIFANPGTLTGSIGVIMEFLDLGELYRWAKVKRYSLKTGRFKDSGADYREMEPDEKALLQSLIDNVLEQFRDAVASGRNLSKQAVVQVSDGRIFSGQQALQAKLVDQLGTFEDAVNEAGKLGEIKGKPKLIYPERKSKMRLLQYLLDSDSEEESSHTKLLNNLGIYHPGLYLLWK